MCMYVQVWIHMHKRNKKNTHKTKTQLCMKKQSQISHEWVCVELISTTKCYRQTALEMCFLPHKKLMARVAVPAGPW